jgi:pentose-5-phosphate-3-epimerase
MFQFSTLQQISNFHEYFKAQRREFLIEADGGLTLQTLRLCKNAGATLFAGWSVIKPTAELKLEQNIKNVYNILKEK